MIILRIYLFRHEFKLMHEEWMNIVKPTFHPATSAQLHEKFEVSDVDIENCKSVRNEMRAALNSLLKVKFTVNLVHMVNLSHCNQIKCLLFLSKAKLLFLYCWSRKIFKLDLAIKENRVYGNLKVLILEAFKICIV